MSHKDETRDCQMLAGSKRKREHADPSRPQEEEFYNMDHPNRGLAVIFNIEHFRNPALNRKGSSNDRDSLDRTFRRLGFETLIFNDLSKTYIENTVNNIRKRNFTDVDCFVLAFMSHGIEGKLLASDEEFDIHLLWDGFTEEQCPSLKNKPKLFFIQACQGNSRHSSVTVPVTDSQSQGPRDERSGIDSHGADLLPSYKIPNRADFLVAMSTISGYISYRDAESGSWFLQELCHNLDQDGYNKDIVSILTHVNNRVALEYEDKRNGEIFKQQPTFMSTLLRILKFLRKPEKSPPPKKKTKLIEGPGQHEYGEVRSDDEGGPLPLACAE